MEAVEHNGPLPLIAFIDEIARTQSAPWGIARVKKTYLRPITDEAFLLAIKPALQEAELAHIFFIDAKRVYIVWKSQKKSIYRHVRTLVGTALVEPGSNVNPSAMVTYIDPFVNGEILKAALKSTGDMADRLFDDAEESAIPEDIDGDDDHSSERMEAKPMLTATSAQAEHFQHMRVGKRYRKQLQILVVEDQIFSQKLLCDVLRNARTRNSNETPLVDATEGIHDAWKIYLKKAPDLTFVDLGLADGSGHTLAHAMKKLDPGSYVIIVTANNYEEELSVAKQNNVNGFISKPYNKKQILDCIERYVGETKTHTKGGGRGVAGQSR